MIHIIYIYFIINAFIAGYSIGINEGFWRFILALFFGIPFYSVVFIYTCSEALFKLIDNKTLVTGWFKLYFTNHFNKMDKETISLRKRQYNGTSGIGRKGRRINKYERLFLEQIDKKYKFGITE